MTDTHRLSLPLTEAAARSLKAGDRVYLDGDMTIAAGMPTFQRITQYMAEGRELPTDLTGAALFHMGSFSQDSGNGLEVLYLNPTTSTRFNPLMPAIIRKYGLRAVGGKGGLDRECAKAMQEVGCVYLSFLGGGAALHTTAIKKVVAVEWPDFVIHFRLVTLKVENLGPLTVGIDAHGNSLYEDLNNSARERLPEIMARLRERREAS